MKTLFVSHTFPYPPIRGDTQRSNLLYRALAKLGEVDLFAIGGRVPAAADVQRVLRDEYRLVEYVQRTMPGERFPWKIFRRLNERWIDRLAHNLMTRKRGYEPDPAIAPRLRKVVEQCDYDLIVGRYISPTALSGAFGLGLPTIIDIDDVDTSIYETRLSAPGTKWWERLIINHHLRQLRQIIPTCIQAAGHVWVASPEDLDVVQHPSKSVLPNIPFGEFNSGVSHLASPSEARPCVLMVGSLTHIVNCRAIDRFLETVWPAVIHEVPQAVFRIVGSGMTPERSARWAAHPQVEAVGFVENLAAEYARCAFAVCPIFEGGGTKIKVLESLAYGRTIAVTRHSMRGYERELVNGESLLIADNEGQLAQACVRLLRDPPLCVRLADAGAGIVSQHFSFERFSDEVRRSVLSVIDREARRGTTGHRDQYFAEHGEK